MKETQYVTVDGEPVTVDGDPVTVTVEGVAEYIDASREVLDDDVADSVLDWLRNQFPDWSYVIDSIDSFVGAMRSGLSRFLDPDNIELVVQLLQSWFY